MNIRMIIIHAIGILLLVPMASCQEEGPAKNGGAAAAPARKLPGDVDLGHGYVRRDGAIHFIGGGTTGTGANATRIDTPSPQLLIKVVANKYGPFKTADGLDVASFQSLSEEYTRDKDRVYYKVISPGVFLVIVLPDADPASFEVLARNIARDRNHVWYYETIQPGADPATVELVDGERVFKDKDSVHYAYDPIVGADPASFRHLASGYYADRNQVYWCTDPILDADPATFEVLGDSFVAKDRGSVYRSGQLLRGLDPASVELILHDPMGYQILSDKHGIHLNDMTFPRSKSGEVTVIDQLTVKAGDRIHLVNTYQITPVTLFKEEGKLMAETPAYEPTTRKQSGIIAAEVTPAGLKNIRAGSAPHWQVEVFKRPDLVRRMIEAGKLIK